MSDEPKKKVIRFAPLVTAPSPVDPTTLACSQEDYTLLVNLGFSVSHGSLSLVTFNKRCKLDDNNTVQINIRFEKDTWTCAIVLNWNKNENIYDAYFSAKHKSLQDLMKRVSLSFRTVHELFQSFNDTFR